MKKNLILGAIKGYDYDKLSPFVHSIKQTSFDGDVCFIVNGILPETKKKLEVKGVNTVEFEYRGSGALNSWSRFWPFIKPFLLNGYNPFTRFTLKKILPLQTARFLHYKDYLKANQHKYKNVLLTDVRDVYFQSDPFSQSSNNTIRFYEEFLKMEDEKLFNAEWIKVLFGDAALAEISHYKILCSGTVIGPVDEVIAFLDRLEKLLITSADVKIGGSDQGMLNYQVRKYEKGQITIEPYGHGSILTVSNIDNLIYKISEGKVFYSDGTLIPVLHQYDRSQQICSALNLLSHYKGKTV